MRECLGRVAAVLLTMGVFGAWAAGQNNAAPPTANGDALESAYTQAMQQKDWPGAVSIAQRLVEQSATADHLRLLANAQINANALPDAMATLDRALAQAQAEKPAEGQPLVEWNDLQGKIWLSKGNALLKSRRTADALAAYTRAAGLEKNPAVATFNICATSYNAGDTEHATDACRKAVSVDPARADAWYVLASLLYASSKTDAHGNFAITAECRQALDKYLELAPNGPHAVDVKAMLDMAAK